MPLAISLKEQFVDKSDYHLTTSIDMSAHIIYINRCIRFNF